MDERLDEVTAAELSEWIGASERTVRELAGREIIVRTGRGKYRLQASVAGYVAHLREVAAGRGPATGPSALDLVAERARLAAEQADAQAMKNDVTRGLVVPVAVAAEDLGRRCARIRTRLLAIPSETAVRVQRAKTAPEAEAIIRDVIYEALEELSGAGEPEA
jgi:terminase small subunit / prophage DNA-packing protein